MIRRATLADLPALVALTHRCDVSQRGWAGDVPLPSPAEVQADWRRRFAVAGAVVLVWEDVDAGVVAGAAFSPAREFRDTGAYLPGLAHVSAVFVDPPFWRRGIARALLGALDDAMRAAGFETARLWTLEGSPAESLYAATGWERDGRRDVYPPMDWTTVGYVKSLTSA